MRNTLQECRLKINALIAVAEDIIFIHPRVSLFHMIILSTAKDVMEQACTPIGLWNKKRIGNMLISPNVLKNVS
ncbi:hypothetical protein [Robertmurraya mangrovi]|nr:hypothetical protein [Bacillus sp. 31A1R]